MSTKSVLVSGAAGFIGRAVTRRLADSGHEVVVALRRRRDVAGASRQIDVGDLAAPGDVLTNAMRGVMAVVHAAGMAHRTGVDPAAMAAANVVAARRVAEAAASRGVPRFVLISSSAVFGKSRSDRFCEASTPQPDDEYARSKLAGEAAVRSALEDTATKLVVVRPCAVIGPGCAGNIPRLVQLIKSGWPLPFRTINNARSFIDVDDLSDLLAISINAEHAPSLVIAAHPKPISTPDLIRALARGLDRRKILLPFPPELLGLGAAILGQASHWKSFAGSFQADVSVAQQALGFRPTTSVETALEQTASSLRYDNTVS
jgi:nucleoside-diphosphate-sugar epimerase